jgi:hypothetical protein
MGTVIQYLLLSIIIVVLWHFIYFFLSDIFHKEEDEMLESTTYDLTDKNEEREKIMSLMREDEQLEEYVKNKLKEY